MKKLIFTSWIIMTLMSLISVANAGAIDALQFTESAQEQRYFNLIKNLRCLKCQNSSIAGSNAALAKNLRLKVYRQITLQNLSNSEIKAWMVARYGDFVLYEPPLKASTIILWSLPILLALLGFGLLLNRLFKTSVPNNLNSIQQDKLEQILRQ